MAAPILLTICRRDISFRISGSSELKTHSHAGRHITFLPEQSRALQSPAVIRVRKDILEGTSRLGQEVALALPARRMPVLTKIRLPLGEDHQVSGP